MTNRRKRDLRCSFCESPEQDVELLITALKVYICDKCVTHCQKILTERKIEKESVRTCSNCLFCGILMANLCSCMNDTCDHYGHVLSRVHPACGKHKPEG